METQINNTDKRTLQSLLQIEDVLDIDMSPVDKTTGDAEIEECNQHLQINEEHINHQISMVSMTALNMLCDVANRLRTNELNFVTGLKLHLIEEDNGFINLLYQPVLMTRPPSILGEPFYSITEGLCYSYDSLTAEFTVIADGAVSTLTANYRNRIKIKHRVDITYTSFIPNMDTESIIFPFQTIYALAKDNSSESIFFHNSIRQEPVGGGYSIKHCVLLSSESLQNNGFEGKFANRSHLCPPSCNQVQYALAK